MSTTISWDPTSFESVIGDTAAIEALRRVSPTALSVASEFWRVPTAAPHLSSRMKELILLAMHASTTALNERAIVRHIRRAKEAGATDADIVDVLVTIVALANHALYQSTPVLLEELAAAGVSVDDSGSASTYETAKAEFIVARGFWNDDKDALVRLMPEYFVALTAQSTESWKNGTLAPKEREFLCIAIDCTVTHTYEPGLRLHIRNAIRHGATAGELGEILQLAALMGLEGLAIGARELVDGDEPA
jgi:alkylhydroperoxidase/carboxymuconolactone decarboxylase family protein YurZ